MVGRGVKARVIFHVYIVSGFFCLSWCILQGFFSTLPTIDPFANVCSVACFGKDARHQSVVALVEVDFAVSVHPTAVLVYDVARIDFMVSLDS